MPDNIQGQQFSQQWPSVVSPQRDRGWKLQVTEDVEMNEPLADVLVQFNCKSPTFRDVFNLLPDDFAGQLIMKPALEKPAEFPHDVVNACDLGEISGDFAYFLKR